MAAHGIGFGAPKVDLDKLRGWKNKVVGKLTGGLDGLAKQRKVEVVRGTGRFVGPPRHRSRPARMASEASWLRALHHRRRLRAGEAAVHADDPRIMDSTGALELPRCRSDCW